MLRELRLSVKTVHDEKYGQYNEVYYDIDGTAYRIFPLFDFGQPVSWVDYDADLFDQIYNDDSQEREFTFKCYGSDISQQAIDIARENIRSAGLMKYVELETKPFQQYTEAPQPGILVTNPPYGERISSRDLLGLYNMIGERLKHVFMGYRAWILSYKEECFDKIGLHPSEKIKLMNGSLSCEYRCYEMFEGTKKEFKTNQAEEKKHTKTNNQRDNKSGDFKRKKVDRPERRFAAAHRDEDEDYGGRFNEKRPAKMRYRDNSDRKRLDKKSSFGGKKKGRFYED